MEAPRVGRLVLVSELVGLRPEEEEEEEEG